MPDSHASAPPGRAPGLPILRVAGVDKTFHASNGPVEALHDINVTIEKGELVCVLGASGCGKSTLLRIIAGFEQATRGSVSVHGIDVDRPGPDRGMVFQDYALFPWLTVRENIEFGPRHRGVPSKAIAQTTGRFLAMVGLATSADRYPHQLSGGMKQRVAIARVLANDAEIVLMDEPFGALDALIRGKLQEDLIEIWQRTKLTIIFVTHSVEEAVLLADQIIVMTAGPGRVDCQINVDLPRPRDVSSPEFNALRRDVTRKLTSHIARSPVGDQPIYRGMDRAALDAAYNNSAAVADSNQWLDQWRSRSDAVRGMPGARLDVAYGPKERTRLDYFSAAPPGAPLFVFLHGGYWQRNSKDMFSFVAEGPRMHGIDVAVVGYTLAPAARLSEIVGEISQALSFLDSNASVFGFDRGAMCVGGWSAGGHLAAMSCGHPGVRGALAISGIFDLEPIALTYINDQLRLDSDEIATLSPARLLRQGMAPLALAVGSDELAELKRQSASFKDIADTLELPVTLQVLPDHHHFSILDELARADGALTRELLRLVARDSQDGRGPP